MRRARSHRTARLHEALTEEIFLTYQVGDRVMTSDGFAGEVVRAEAGPYGASYEIVLDDGLGGGEYTESSIVGHAQDGNILVGMIEDTLGLTLTAKDEPGDFDPSYCPTCNHWVDFDEYGRVPQNCDCDDPECACQESDSILRSFPPRRMGRRYSDVPLVCDGCGATATTSVAGGKEGHTMLCPACADARGKTAASRGETEPHEYVAWGGNNRWRTCQVCGKGANAEIHRGGKTAARANLPLAPRGAVSTAEDDYPELDGILWDRPDHVAAVPVSINQVSLGSRTASKTAASMHSLMQRAIRHARDVTQGASPRSKVEYLVWSHDLTASTLDEAASNNEGDLIDFVPSNRAHMEPYVHDKAIVQLNVYNVDSYGSRDLLDTHSYWFDGDDVYWLNRYHGLPKIAGPATTIEESIEDKSQPLWWRKVVGPSFKRMNDGLDPAYQMTDINRVPGNDWCRFRRESHCYFPKALDEEGTRKAGYAVWIPEDRGRCSRITHADQASCEISEPGPNSGEAVRGPDGTRSWAQGGQRYSSLSTTAASPRQAYDSGWRAFESADPVAAMTRADRRGAPREWYIGFHDAAAGNPKYDGLDNPESEWRKTGAGKPLMDMSRDEFDALSPRLLYHGTNNSSDLDTLLNEGVRMSNVPMNLARQRYQAGEYAEFAPGAGAGVGLYASASVWQASQFGRSVVAIEVSPGDYVVPPESEGSKMEWALTDANGVLIVKDIPANRVHLVHRNSPQYATADAWETAQRQKTAAWGDVVQKGKRIRQEGGVRIIANTGNTVTAEVHGDNDIYVAAITRVPGTKQTGMSYCACDWEKYRWARSAPYKRFEGRSCSHILALAYEIQAQEMFGGQIEEQAQEPSWSNPFGPRTDRRDGQEPDSQDLITLDLTSALERESALLALGNIRDALLVAQAENEGETLGRVSALLATTASAEDHLRSATAARTAGFKAQVDGSIRDVTGLAPDGAVVDGGRIVPPSAVLYPTYHPSIGLTAAFIPKTADVTDYDQIDFDANAAYWSGKADAARARDAAEQRLRDMKGQEIEVIKGRKIPIGTKGTVFYSGEGQWGWRIGFTGTDGETYWTDAKNVELVSERTASKTAVTLYHGTTADRVDGIRSNGLTPPPGKGSMNGWYMLTTSYDQAARYAQGSGERVVVEYDIPDDRIYSRDHDGPGDLLWPGVEHDVYDFDAVAYAPRGPIPSSFIKDVHHVGSKTATAEDEAAAIGAIHSETDGTEVAFAGLIIKAADSGRVLMTQRTPYHGDDPETYGKWEFPGGHLDDGEDAIEGAMREFFEETGLTLPDEAEIRDHYVNGKYVGIVVLVPNEAWTTDAELLALETMGIGWFEWKDAVRLGRPEINRIDESLVAEASVQESYEDEDGWHDEDGLHVGMAEAALLDEPEPVMGGDEPGTVYGETDADDQQQFFPDGLPMLAHLAPNSPNPKHFASPGGGGSKDDGVDIATAAREFLAKEGVKVFSPAEQKALIDEGAHAHVGASNTDRLDLSGTFYEGSTSGAPIPDDEILW